MGKQLNSERISVDDSIEEINNLYIKNRWSDGLPIIPPSEEAVGKMLAGTNRNATDVIGSIPISEHDATVEKIAINAVMAGCLPEYMPVIITAIEAMCDKKFNLKSLQSTTHPVSPLLIVNGPIVKQIDINSKYGSFGPGWRSNATIGRAIRLIMMNIGEAIPGKTAMSTQGQPSRYTFCIAENEEESPWEPLHVERGYPASTSTVTVVDAENPHNINDHIGTSAEEILTTIISVMATMGNNNILSQYGEPVLALGPEHAATIAKDGFSKKDIKSYIHEKARIPRRNFYEKARQRYFSNMPEDTLLPITATSDDLIIIVLGGAGKHSSFLPSLGHGISVTKPIA